MAQTIFSRLRSMKPRKGQPLSELIAEASDVGDECVVALAALLNGCAIIAKSKGINIEAETLAFVDSPFAKARRALDRAYADNGHTPDNGKAAA